MKPLAFRIRNFRSIKDSGEFSASGDNITVLAGQNEAGKTAVLLALRDFDQEPGEPPETPEFRPEGDLEAEPRVAIQFQLEEGDLEALREEIEFPEFFDRFAELETFWIERHLLTGTFTLDAKLEEVWNAAEAAQTATEAGDKEDGDEEPEEGSRRSPPCSLAGDKNSLCCSTVTRKGTRLVIDSLASFSFPKIGLSPA